MPIVVPTTTTSTSAGSMPASASTAATVATGSSGFEGTLARNERPASSTATRSVNVPPVSMPTLTAICRSEYLTLGGLGGTPLVAGVRWSFRGKDAGSARSRRLRVRLRTPPRGEQRGPAAQSVFRQVLPAQGVVLVVLVGVATVVVGAVVAEVVVVAVVVVVVVGAGVGVVLAL